MVKVVFGTSNPKKLADLQIIPAPHIELFSLADIGVAMPDVEENGSTFTENARIKYDALRPLVPPEYLLATEDSGLEIHALGNQPGVFSGRWNPERREMTDEELIIKTIRELDGKTDRSAQFVSAIVFGMTSDQSPRTAVGQLLGTIQLNIDEDQRVPGMPYRALFYVDSAGMMLQHLIDTPYNQRETRTHRELAWQQFLAQLI